MNFIKKAFEGIGNGIKGTFKAVGEIAKGVVTLDLKGTAKGAVNLIDSAGEVSRNAMNLTPSAIAANTLLDGAVDKLSSKPKKMGLIVAKAALEKATDERKKP